jgi:hypothetical protein
MAINLTKKYGYMAATLTNKNPITMEDITCNKQKQIGSKTKAMLTAVCDVECLVR